MSKFLSCDWGGSSFRLRLVETRTGEIYSETQSDMGISETWRQWLSRAKPESGRIQFYTSKLTDAINLLPATIEDKVPVIISGMASSSMGLAELPYQKFPFNWDPKQLIVQKMNSEETFKHPLYLVSGFKTDDDVMRGEETLLLGFDITDDGERVFIFPGTHSKHVYVKQKTGVDFKTYLTGELFHLLTEKSILHTAVTMGQDEKSFAVGFDESREGNLLHNLFKIRTRWLLQRADAVSNYQWLSGLLIGTELKDLENNDCPVYLVCSDHLKDAYMQALQLLNKNRKIIYLKDDVLLVKGHCRIADNHFTKTAI